MVGGVIPEATAENMALSVVQAMHAEIESLDIRKLRNI